MKNEVVPTIQYYGTNLNSYGHYFWFLNETYLYESGNWYENLPFNPERDYSNKNGSVHFEVVKGYSVLSITGSCHDQRPASKSVFFTSEELTQEEFLNKLKQLPIFNKMIEKMNTRFTVDL